MSEIVEPSEWDIRMARQRRAAGRAANYLRAIEAINRLASVSPEARRFLTGKLPKPLADAWAELQAVAQEYAKEKP